MGGSGALDPLTDFAFIFFVAVPRAAAASCPGERFFGAISKLTICEMRVEVAVFAVGCSIGERAAAAMALARSAKPGSGRCEATVTGGRPGHAIGRRVEESASRATEYRAVARLRQDRGARRLAGTLRAPTDGT